MTVGDANFLYSSSTHFIREFPGDPHISDALTPGGPGLAGAAAPPPPSSPKMALEAQRPGWVICNNKVPFYESTAAAAINAQKALPAIAGKTCGVWWVGCLFVSVVVRIGPVAGTFRGSSRQGQGRWSSSIAAEQGI